MPTNLRSLWLSAPFVLVWAAACGGGGTDGNSQGPGGSQGSDGGPGSKSPGTSSDGGADSTLPGAVGTPGTCVPDSGAPTLPASFTLNCGGCHSATGAPANPAVPNLFTYTTSSVTGTTFLAQVRNPPAGGLMPAFTTAQISDADVQQIYAYFAAGTPGQMATCEAPDGGQTGNLGGCSNETISYAPLFQPSDGQVNPPISYVDPTTKHLVFRGAGRVRFRHEMEDTYEVYHDHYFEDRVFGYTLDDSIPAGGTTIVVTYDATVNQYWQAQNIDQLGGADLNMRIWKVYGGVDGNVFYDNTGGKPTLCPDATSPSCNTMTGWQQTITTNSRTGMPMKMGDQLQVEFGIFESRWGKDGGPPSGTSHIRNVFDKTGAVPNGCVMNGPPYNNACYTQANYYSDSFRYVVGTGSLTPANQDCTMEVPIQWQGTAMNFPHPYDCSSTGPIAQAISSGKIKSRVGPEEPGWSGGITTIPYLRARWDLYYSQMAPNTQIENAPNFVKGRELFHTDFTTGLDEEVNNEVTAAETAPLTAIAGPLYNQVACDGCHTHNNRGFPPAAGMPFHSIVVKTEGVGQDVHGGPTLEPNYGGQLQQNALDGVTPEGNATFSYETVNGRFNDGTAYTLTKPTVSFMNLSAGTPLAYSVRLARPLIGMGLLEAIPEANILANADPTDCNGDGIKGVPNLVFDPEDGTMKVGRFGWKASKASVTHQVAEALAYDIGVTTRVFPGPDCGPMETACLTAPAKPSLSDSGLDQMVTYMRDLGVVPRRDLTDPPVVRGEMLFAQMGCSSCHVPNQSTGTTTPFVELQNQTIHPYSDLLLHDMGPDLADSSNGEYVATPTMWRTPPLWGIGMCDQVALGSAGTAAVAAGFAPDSATNPAPNLGPCHYLHDGRAASLLEAVLWHGGEAAAVKARVLALSSADRDALVAFLGSL